MMALQLLLNALLPFAVTMSSAVANNDFFKIEPTLPAVKANYAQDTVRSESDGCVDKKDLPIIFFHGLTGSSADGDNIAANITAEGRAFAALSFCEKECSLKSLNFQLPAAIAAVRDVVTTDDRFKDGYIFMGHSMGALLARAVIETMDDHKVHTFVSLAGALNGIYYGPQDADRVPVQLLAQGSGAAALPPTVFNFSDYSVDEYRGKMQYDWARKLTDPEVQAAYSWANLARFPVHEVWVDTNQFIPLFNNVNKCASTDSDCEAEKSRRKRNFLKITEAHLFASPQDGVATPWQIGHFGQYDEVETLEEIESKFEDLSILKVHDTMEFKEDTFGLRTLENRGGLFLYTAPNVSHPCWLQDYTYFYTEGTCEFKPVYDEYVYKAIS